MAGPSRIQVKTLSHENGAISASRFESKTATFLRHRIRPPLLAVIFIGVILRLYHFTSPPLDYHSFRQTQTLMVARNYYLTGVNLLQPRVDWLPTDRLPVYAPVGGTEFPIVPALTAVLYHLVGLQHWAGRVVSMVFAVVAVAYFHAFTVRLFNARVGWLAAVFLTVSPLFLVTSRVQMPEAFAFAMAFAGLFHFDSWLLSKRIGHLCAAAAFTALMLLGKPQLAVFGVAWLAIGVLRRGWPIVADYRLYALGLLSVLPAVAFVMYSASLTRTSGVSFTITALFDYRYITYLPYWVTMATWTARWGAGFGVFAMGLGGMFWPRPDQRVGFLVAWILSGIALLVLIPGGSNSNPHYLIVFAPALSILAARLVDAIASRRRMLPPAAGSSLLAVGLSLYAAAELAKPVSLADYRAGTWLRDNTSQDTLILYSHESPAAMYFSERRGWVSWYEGDGTPIDFGPELINRVARLGARVVAVTAPQVATNVQSNNPFDGMRTTLRDVLYDTYLSYDGDGFAVFFLTRRADLTVSPGAPITFTSPEARKFLRGDWNITYFESGSRMRAAIPAGGKAGLRIQPSAGATRLTLTLAPSNEGLSIDVGLNNRPLEIRPIPDGHVLRLVIPLDHFDSTAYLVELAAHGRNEGEVQLIDLDVTD